MSLPPTISANYTNSAVINSFNDGVVDFTTEQDGQGLKIINNTTSGYLEISSAGAIVSPDGVATYPINFKDLSAITTNTTPQELVVVNTIAVQDATTTPPNNIQIQAGVIGVGTNFGIEYSSSTDQDFTIFCDENNTGGVLYKQEGFGASTTQTKITQGTIVSSDTASGASNTIQPTSVAFNTTSGEVIGSYTGNSNSIGYDGVGSGAGSGSITSSISNQSGTIVSAFAGGVANIPTPPYPASDAQFYLSVNSSTRNPTLTFQNSAPFENSTTLNIDLNNIIHNQGTGSPSPNTDFTISTNKNLVLTADNVDLSSTGRLILPSLASADYLDYNAGTLALKSNNVGYLTDELLLLENTNTTAGNTTGVPSLEMFKSGRNGAIGDIVSTIQFNAKDGAGVKRSFGRIESTITTNTAPTNYDGSLDFYSLINGVNNLVFRLNGADNENNSFRPLDLNGNSLKTSALDLTIDGTGSTGNGAIILNPKPTSGAVITNGKMTIPSISDNLKVGDISTQQGTLGATFVGFNDSIGVLASSLSNTTMTITNGTTNQQTQLTTNQLYINDTQNNKSIAINNDAGSGNTNRIDLFKNQGGGIYNTSGIVNDTQTQNLFLLYQDNSNGRSLIINNDSASGGVIEYSDQIGQQPFNITNQQSSLTLNVPTAGQPLQFNSDIINLQNTNTTTSTPTHTSALATTSNIGDITTYLKLQLNGTDIWVPYFTQDPSI